METRVIDINIAQQKTPRIWKTKTGKERTLQDMLNNVDAYIDNVITYDDIDLEDTEVILAPAPYVADKIDIHKEKDWNEFLRLIGIANMNFQKKERNIKDEVLASQGGTIASRYSRFEPRKKAIDEINEKFINYLDAPIEVKYYDGLPTSLDSFIENTEEVVEDDTI